MARCCLRFNGGVSGVVLSRWSMGRCIKCLCLCLPSYQHRLGCCHVDIHRCRVFFGSIELSCCRAHFTRAVNICQGVAVVLICRRIITMRPQSSPVAPPSQSGGGARKASRCAYVSQRKTSISRRLPKQSSPKLSTSKTHVIASCHGGKWMGYGRPLPDCDSVSNITRCLQVFIALHSPATADTDSRLTEENADYGRTWYLTGCPPHWKAALPHPSLTQHRL